MRIDKLCSTIFLSGFFLLPGLANSQFTVIDFDEFVDNPSGGGEITGNEFASLGISFSTPDLLLDIVDVTILGYAGFGNALSVIANDGVRNLNIEFDPGTAVSDLCFFVSNASGGLVVNVYDVDGVLLSTFVGGPDPNLDLCLGGFAVNRVEITEADFIDGVSFTVANSEPGVLLENLVTTVVSYNLAAGIGNSLDSKLQNAIDALDRAQNGDIASATGILYAFMQSVEAQRGKKLTDAQASELVDSAQTIIDALTGP